MGARVRGERSEGRGWVGGSTCLGWDQSSPGCRGSCPGRRGRASHAWKAAAAAADSGCSGRRAAETLHGTRSESLSRAAARAGAWERWWGNKEGREGGSVRVCAERAYARALLQMQGQLDGRTGGSVSLLRALSPSLSLLAALKASAAGRSVQQESVLEGSNSLETVCSLRLFRKDSKN